MTVKHRKTQPETEFRYLCSWQDNGLSFYCVHSELGIVTDRYSFSKPYDVSLEVLEYQDRDFSKFLPVTTTALLRGHKIEFVSGQWRYKDTGEPTEGNPRQCGKCKANDRPDGHDACLGELQGIMNACCGHGDDAATYVQFLDGSTISGEDAAIILDILKRQ